MISERLVNFPGSLPEQMEALWNQQAAEWPRLASGLVALRQARTRRFELDESTLMVQSNSARIVSTGAKMDPASLAARPCFLCPANLPAEQLAILYHDRWLILCNPAPIFDPHFVISLAGHEPQRVLPAFEIILDLARDLDGQYTIFYNGPRCGASAPDHLHVQAIKAGLMPFEQELMGELFPPGDRVEMLRDHPVRLGVTRNGMRSTVVLAGDDRPALVATLEEVTRVLGEVHPAEPEPMLNLFALYSPEVWLVYLFPRSVHRPACYGMGPGQFVVSPGCVDLGGILVAPRQEDFERLTPEIARRLLNEVLLSPECFAQVRERLGQAKRSDS